MKKMKPYKRNQELPAPVPEQRGPVAERNGHHGYSDWNGYTASAPYVPTVQTQVAPPPLPGLAPQAVYLEVLFQQIKKRWKMLFVWMLLSAALAGFVVIQYGKPSWKAEGILYYSPNYNLGGSNSLYRPPNIQTVLAMAKSPEIAEKAAKEANINATPDQLQSKLNVTIVKQSDMISVAFEWPDKDQAVNFTTRYIDLVVEQNHNLQRRLSEGALTELDNDLQKVTDEELAKSNELNEALGRKGIYDLKTETSTVIHEISSWQSEIKNQEREKESLEMQILQIDIKMKDLMEAQGGAANAAPSTEEVVLLNLMRETKAEQLKRKQEIEQAQAELKPLEEQYKKLLSLYQKGYATANELGELKGKIDKLKVITSRSNEIKENEQQLEELQKRILSLKKGTGSVPLQQLRLEKMLTQVRLSVIPGKIAALQKSIDDRLNYQKFLKSVEKNALQIQKEIDSLQQRWNILTTQKELHKKLATDKMNELSVYSTASAGSTPLSTNHFKLAAAVIGLSMLLFLGFVAMYDMPRVMPAAMAMPYQQTPSLAGSQLPVPAWQNQPHPPQPQPQGAPRAPSMNNEHLRALSERIMESASERASIVLFTPTSGGLRVENLLGDLGCFLNRNGNRVLVFEARNDAENPPYPAWTGPSAREVAAQLENYLEGQHERGPLCFAETLISGIDYARADLARHLAGVMPMYRFRRLMQDMKERYSIVLMITPERYQGEEDDVFTTLGEGIVVVINQDADPEDVEAYLRDLRASETPVFGAVTLPPGQNF